jgi:hypothetical protein
MLHKPIDQRVSSIAFDVVKVNASEEFRVVAQGAM